MNGVKYHYPQNDRYIKLNATKMIPFIQNYQNHYNIDSTYTIKLDKPDHVIIIERTHNRDTNITFWVEWDFHLDYYYRTESLYPM